MSKKYCALALACALQIYSPASVDAQELTLAEALSRALAADGRLAALDAEIRAREAELRQARLFANPELELEYGGFNGGAPADEEITRLEVSQPLGTDGLRRSRTRLAGAELQLARRDLDAARSDLQRDVARAFLEAAAAQQALARTEELAGISDRVLQAIRTRVEAGSVAAIEETRFRSALATSRMDVEAARAALDGARARLASTWRADAPDFTEVSAELSGALPDLDLAELQAALDASPPLARAADEAARSEAEVALERARGRSDLSLAVGLERFHASSEDSYLVGLRVPLPLFDRNQGAVAAARERGLAAGETRRTERAGLLAELASVFREYEAARRAQQLLDEEVLPAARESFDATQFAYERGRFGLLDVLDARRALVDAREREIDVRLAARMALVELARLTGRSPLAWLSADAVRP